MRPSRAGRGWASRISTPEEDPFVTANRKGAQPEMTLLPYEMPHVVLQRPTLKKKKKTSQRETNLTFREECDSNRR